MTYILTMVLVLAEMFECSGTSVSKISKFSHSNNYKTCVSIELVDVPKAILYCYGGVLYCVVSLTPTLYHKRVP